MGEHSLGVLGGTFDPVHAGHLHVAEKCREALALDLVIFMPCRRSPHKDEAPEASNRERLHMLTLALAGHSWAAASTLETDRPPPSYSWITAEQLAEAFPGSRISWIMGSDQWDVLHTWDRPEHLASLVEFAVVHRGSPPAPQPEFEATFLKDEHPASASAIRSALRAHAKPRWLDPKVERFIAERGLYQGQA